MILVEARILGADDLTPVHVAMNTVQSIILVQDQIF
jgi:hypothetical protein